MHTPLRLAGFVLTASLLISCDQDVNAQTATDTTSGVDNQDAHVDRKTITPSSEGIIPGPLRSFLRMAGISQKASPEDVLPLLARNVYGLGYERGWFKGRRSEFILLLTRFVQQAREFLALARPVWVSCGLSCRVRKAPLAVLGG